MSRQARSGFLMLLFFLCLAEVASAAGGAGGLDTGGAGGASTRRKTDTKKLNEIWRAGVTLLAAEDCKAAEKKFRDVLKKVPHNAEANTLRGMALQCQQDHKAAIRCFKRAKRDDSKFYLAYEKLGLSYLALDQKESAQDELEELAAIKKRCEADNQRCPAKLVKAHQDLTAAIMRSSGQPVDTTSGDQHGLLFRPDADPDASYLAAVSLINSGRFDEAIEKLRDLGAALGPHPDILNYLGYANRRLGRFEQAKLYYEQALAIDPLHRGANEYLGEMWAELGQTEEARVRLAVLEEACPFGCVEYEDLKRVIESRLVAGR